MKNRGSILIFTLWVLIILSIISIALSRRAATDMRLAKRESQSIKALYLAKAGIFKMLAELSVDTNKYDALNEDWHRGAGDPKKLTLRDDMVFYGASDEMALLNLNAESLKKEEISALGLDPDLSEAVVKYREMKGDKGFEFMEEIFLVEGMTREAFSNIKSSVTIYRGNDHKVNINTAGEKVLAAILGDDLPARNISDYRIGPDEREGTADDGIFRDTADITNNFDGVDTSSFSVVSGVFRVWAESVLSGDREPLKKIEAVIDRSTGNIRHWKEY
ncbi:MAG: general secretion pathway protein GspK [Candidatus Omnitrophica bacterium]|nr:general secretion pathway protein GspK [Candidatus Omnitrophota bacterium]